MFAHRLTICTFSGIKIGIDISWIFIAILLSWTLAVGYFPASYPGLFPETYWVMGIVGMLGLFVCILLHEMGHAFVAKHYQLPVSNITLFIFGGIAEIKKEPPNPKVEFLVSIAGPIVSIILALCMYGLTLSGEQLGWPVVVRGITGYLALINLLIVAFNMIPAFPLDGGRVLRSLLWWWTKNLTKATKVVTALGEGFGFFLIFLGIFFFIGVDLITGFWFMIIGWFLQRAASSSRTELYVGKELRSEKVADFMTATPITVSPNITLKEFIERHVYKSHHHLYPVTDNDELLGYISIREVKATPADDWSKVTVKEVLVPLPKLQTVKPETSALDALNLMNQTSAWTLLVADGSSLKGILTAHELFKFISLKLELS